ncbi:MAG: hypothetical protein HY713_00015 [candidate division NC10 bacterium]|nr:hypothetical protein [candidate division NC10 bacterium]
MSVLHDEALVGEQQVRRRFRRRHGRHTYATHPERASGAELEVVREQLGHASVKTTTNHPSLPLSRGERSDPVPDSDDERVLEDAREP